MTRTFECTACGVQWRNSAAPRCRCSDPTRTWKVRYDVTGRMRTQPRVTWQPYGTTPYETSDGVLVFLWRKTQRTRWYDVAGRQIGPEQTNVAPAIAYALASAWHRCDRIEWRVQS